MLDTDAQECEICGYNDRTDRNFCDNSLKFLTYQLTSVGYWPTEALTGNGELGFDSGGGA